MTIFWSAKKRRKDTFFQLAIPFARSFLQLQKFCRLYCFAVLGSTSKFIHSLKQRLLRNRPGSDAATSLPLSARKITKGIHSCKPASLNRPVEYRYPHSSQNVMDLHILDNYVRPCKMLNIFKKVHIHTPTKMLWTYIYIG